MVERRALSKGEMEVARVLWEIGPAVVRTVHETLSEQREIDFATVQTYLRRLEKKGYASSRLDGRIRIYVAKTKARTVIRETVDDLVDRLFGGDSMPLVRHLIEDRGIDADDLSELRDLIDRLDKNAASDASSDGRRQKEQS
jgi:predicted transcriptional regulator